MKSTDILSRGVKELSSNWKNMYDYYKHLTTLGLGAILFISAFFRADKASTFQEITIGVSIFAFLASICFALEVMTKMGNMMIYYSSVQALTNLIDADVEEENEKRLVELKDKITELVDKIGKEDKPIKRRAKAGDYFFLAGVVSASIFVLAPAINKLLTAVGILKQ